MKMSLEARRIACTACFYLFGLIQFCCPYVLYDFLAWREIAFCSSLNVTHICNEYNRNIIVICVRTHVWSLTSYTWNRRKKCELYMQINCEILNGHRSYATNDKPFHTNLGFVFQRYKEMISMCARCVTYARHSRVSHEYGSIRVFIPWCSTCQCLCRHIVSMKP